MIKDNRAFAGLLTLGILAIIVGAAMLYVGLFITATIGNQFSSTLDIQTATGKITYGGTSNRNETLKISTETFTLTNGTAGAFRVDLGLNTGNASYTCSRTVAEINANSTFVTASTCSANATTLTSKIAGSAGNYAITSNVTGITVPAALTGGQDANSAYGPMKSNINTAFTILGLALLVGGFGIVIYVLRTGFMGGGEVR